MAKNFYDITLAFAGICQAAALVQQCAHHGETANAPTLTALHSLLDLDPISTLAVYGGDEANLRCGLQAMNTVLSGASRQNVSLDIARYTLGLVILARRFSSNSAVQTTLAQRISQLQRQLQHYTIDSDTMVRAIAAIYVDTISPLGARIQVTGPSAILHNQRIQDRVRALLLAGIRSAVLWRQMGGSRLQLILKRNRLIQEAKIILGRLPLVD